MTWEIQLERAPAKKMIPWDSNEIIQQEWEKQIEGRGAKNTQRNLRTYSKVFFRSFNDLITTLGPQDIQNFVDQIGTKCARLMNGTKPICLSNLDINNCPLLQGEPDFSVCPEYSPLQPSATWSYICVINRLYEWLRECGRISINPALPIMRDFAKNNEPYFMERRRKPERRHLTTEEVKILVECTPINHGVAYLLMAKCFLRIHELMKLRWSEDYCNMKEGWIDIPQDAELGDKRKGNPRIVIDAELYKWLKVYRAWWSQQVKRDAKGVPVTDKILITTRGLPWGSSAINNFNNALKAHSRRLGLMPDGPCERREKINSHCFRAFATTVARNRGASTPDLQVLRGDLSPGAIIRYDDYFRRLPKLYRDHAPVIGV